MSALFAHAIDRLSNERCRFLVRATGANRNLAHVVEEGLALALPILQDVEGDDRRDRLAVRFDNYGPANPSW